jgi:ABC-2 type transport system ATP-binding protein
MTAAIQTHLLSRSFGSIQAVKSVDLRVPKHSVYGFLGLNGAGKTTTIRMLLGLARPSAGTVTLLGLPIPEARGSVATGGMLETPTIYPHLTGRENVGVIQRIYALPKRNVDHALDTVGLASVSGRLVRGYSTGMKQRLALAVALVHEPDLLILDEPTNGLDPEGIQEVRELLRRFPQTYGTTVFVSSHILSEIEHTATHVGILHRGALVLQEALGALVGKGGCLRVGVTEARQAVAALEPLGWTTTDVQSDSFRVGVTCPADAAAVNAALIRAGHVAYHLSFEKISLEQAFFRATGIRGGVAA